MAIVKELAQVLRIHEQGNTSLVLVMLGRRLGQFRIYAKGARRWPKKGFEGGFDMLTRGEMVFFPRSHEGLWIFKEWEEHARPALGHTPEQLLSASYLCELTEALTRETAGALADPLDSHSSNIQLYDELARSAAALAAGAPPGAVLLHFTLAALQIEGLLPDLDSCTRCELPLTSKPETGNRRPETNGGHPARRFWFSGHGCFCNACAIQLAREHTLERGIWLTPEAQRALAHWARGGRGVRVSAAAAAQLARAMMLLVHAGLEHDLHTLRRAAQSVADLPATSKAALSKP